MVDEGVFCTTAEVQRKVGANVSAISNVEAFINQYVAEAESEINVRTRFNWSDVYSTLDADNRDILKALASNLAAIMVIQYDMGSTSTSRTEFENRINVLRDAVLRLFGVLRDDKNQKFLAVVP